MIAFIPIQTPSSITVVLKKPLPESIIGTFSLRGGIL
tara:strand:+ start:512 stop:622 length:111 start_codon:yes stop_codon:yes gene_type:complete